MNPVSYNVIYDKEKDLFILETDGVKLLIPREEFFDITFEAEKSFYSQHFPGQKRYDGIF